MSLSLLFLFYAPNQTTVTTTHPPCSSQPTRRRHSSTHSTASPTLEISAATTCSTELRRGSPSRPPSAPSLPPETRSPPRQARAPRYTGPWRRPSRTWPSPPWPSRRGLVYPPRSISCGPRGRSSQVRLGVSLYVCFGPRWEENCNETTHHSTLSGSAVYFAILLCLFF